MRIAARLVPVVVLPLLALVACAPGGGSGTAGSGDTGGGGSSPDCSGATTAGYDLFVDPDLTIDPQQEVYDLAGGQVITFHDEAIADRSAPSYFWSTAFIQGNGGVIPDFGSPFFDPEVAGLSLEAGDFVLDPATAPTGVSDGPLPGFLTIEVTDDSGTTPLATLCVILPAS